MSALAEVFARLISDPSFADDIRRNPVEALRSFDLDAGELARLESALGVVLTRDGDDRGAAH